MICSHCGLYHDVTRPVSHPETSAVPGTSIHGLPAPARAQVVHITRADRQFALSWWERATPGEKAAMREAANG